MKMTHTQSENETNNVQTEPCT